MATLKSQPKKPQHRDDPRARRRHHRGSETPVQARRGIHTLARSTSQQGRRSSDGRRPVYEDRVTIMKPSSTHFGVPENPASSGPHDLRLATDVRSKFTHTRDLDTRIAVPANDSSTAEPDSRSNVAPQRAATGEREVRRLLSIGEVAEMLHVPVSWVYGRMRKRSRERLPGYRLGKYWRFREDEVLRWVQEHHEGFDGA